MDPVDDWVDAVTHATSPPELMTVGPDFAVVHEGTDVRRYDGLEPDATQQVEGFTFRTLPEPGERLATFATVNDVHFGETECAGHRRLRPRADLSRGAGRDPYPEVMNRGAVAEVDRASTPTPSW